MELDLSSDDVRTCVHHDHDYEKHEDQQKQHHFHVLAVDDSLTDRKLLERLLTISSYQVTCVDSGDKALEYLGIEENKYESSSKHSEQEVSKINMIMTDYSMPGITGYDLLKRIKDSSWKNIPVVVMSSENVPSRINMCLEGGAEEFLLKPVKPSDVEKLHSHLLKYNHNQLNDDDDDDDDDDYSNANDDNPNDIIALNEDNAIAITINQEINDVCNKEDRESDMSTCTNSNKRKTISSTTTTISSDVSDRRARVQELSVS